MTARQPTDSGSTAHVQARLPEPLKKRLKAEIQNRNSSFQDEIERWARNYVDADDEEKLRREIEDLEQKIQQVENEITEKQTEKKQLEDELETLQDNLALIQDAEASYTDDLHNAAEGIVNFGMEISDDNPRIKDIADEHDRSTSTVVNDLQDYVEEHQDELQIDDDDDDDEWGRF